MARPLRLEYEGAVYHLTGRGNRRERIFEDEKDCARFLELVSHSAARYGVLIHAYVLMGNHYHLLAQTLRANLGRWMHWLITSYTIYFNRRHRRVGHLFQGRYQSIVVEADEYLLPLSRYIHLNPVRGARLGKGELKERRARLRQWQWSSYRGYAGLAVPEPMISEELVFGALGRQRGGKRLGYRRFVEQGLAESPMNPLAETKWQAVLGSESFEQKIIDRVNGWREKRREVKALRHGKRTDSAERILALVAKAYGMTEREVREQGGRDQEAKGVAMTLIWDAGGHSLRGIGLMFAGRDYAAVAQQVRRTKQRALAKGLALDFGSLRDLCQGV